MPVTGVQTCALPISLNTTFVALLPVASLLIVGSGILGAVTLRDFALALFVGLLVGAYSSIFVATPILAKLKEREPRNQALRERSAAQLARVGGAPGASQAAGTASPRSASDDESADGQAGLDQSGGSGSTTDEARGGAATPDPRDIHQSPADGSVAPRPRQQRRRKRR